jgi:transcriptional regulator with XRE-family HTH domain
MLPPIKEIREKLGMTQEEFGNAIGVGQAAISQYEQGHRELKVKLAKKIVLLAEKHNFKITLDQIYEEI